MRTPSPKYFCPRCRTAYEFDMNYCGRCGADMHRASRLQHALRTNEDSSHKIPTRAETSSDRVPLDTSAISEDSGPPFDRRRVDLHDEWLGKIVDNRYKVLEVLGRGGMGVVYKVEHQRMGKIAAMKVLHHDLARDREVIRRFQTEAEAVSRLNHPNTVQVFDFGMAQGALYLVMEYVRGLDIGSLIDRNGPIDFATAAPLFAQICAALHEAHDMGVVHRDLKPENILVTRTHGGHDFVKVLDFGLAKLSEREELAEVTGRGSIVGTPYYMSPEQIRGEHIDPRADIYSLGALMYRVLTGEHCFVATTPVGVLTKHLTESAIPPSRRRADAGLTSTVDAIVLRALAKEPQKRHQSVSELMDELEQACASTGDSSSVRRRFQMAWTAGTSPASRADSSDELAYSIASEQRLRRSDLDAYERSIKRRRRILLVGAPMLAIAAAVAGAYFIALRPPQAAETEREPNNHIDHATLIAPDTAVTAKLGQRISTTEPDHDFFRIDTGGVTTTATVHVSALPNIDIVVLVYTVDGKLLLRRDAAPRAGDEWVRRLRVSRPIVVEVTEAVPEGTMPTENVSDWYTVTVQLSPEDPRLETEPNDSDSSAYPLGPGTPVTGTLARGGDVDAYRWDGEDGKYALALSGAKTSALAWQVGDGPARTERKATLTLRRGDVVRLTGKQTPKAATAGTAEPEAYTLDVTPAP